MVSSWIPQTRSSSAAIPRGSSNTRRSFSSAPLTNLLPLGSAAIQFISYPWTCGLAISCQLPLPSPRTHSAHSLVVWSSPVVNKYPPSFPQLHPIASLTCPLTPTPCTHRSSPSQYLHTLQLPVFPNATTLLPSGAHSPAHKPPTDPVAVDAPLTSEISPILPTVTHTPLCSSAAHTPSDESADAVSSRNSFPGLHAAEYTQSSCPISSASNVTLHTPPAARSTCALLLNRVLRP